VNSSDGKTFVLPVVPATLPATPSWTMAASYVGPGGYATTNESSGSYRLTYAYWKDANSSLATNTRLVRLGVVLSSPPRVPLDKAATRYEVTTSFLLP